MARARPCRQPGCPALVDGRQAWCSEHRAARTDSGYLYRSSSAWQRERRAILESWRAEHGDTCPGDEHHGPHACTDLTVDHLDRLAVTGGLDTGRRRVLCRAANSAWRRSKVPSTPPGVTPLGGHPRSSTG